MAETDFARKLTVILYADVAGYSRLMGLDEAGTHRTVSERLDELTARIGASGGTVLRYAGRADEAIENLKKALRLNPQHPNIWLHFLAHAHFVRGEYEEAATLLSRRIRLYPETDISRVLLASCYGHMGRDADAAAEWARALEVNPDYSIEHKARILPYKNPADWERFADGLRKAGVSGVRRGAGTASQANFDPPPNQETAAPRAPRALIRSVRSRTARDRRSRSCGKASRPPAARLRAPASFRGRPGPR